MPRMKLLNENIIMDFAKYLISENCQGCNECDPLSDERQEVVCLHQGDAKWYVQKAKEFIRKE